MKWWRKAMRVRKKFAAVGMELMSGIVTRKQALHPDALSRL
jgi:hypothetical protein